MASIRNLKKDVNYVFGDIIEAVYIWENITEKYGTKEAEAIIDEAISDFDELMAQINKRNCEDKAARLKEVKAALEAKAKHLIKKINELS